MKVKELLGLLLESDDFTDDLEREIILARDSEQDSYSALYGFWTGIYVPEEMGAYMEKITKEDIKAGYTKEDVASTDDGQKALFLIPAG